jgi:hypothetical protein
MLSAKENTSALVELCGRFSTGGARASLVLKN